MMIKDKEELFRLIKEKKVDFSTLPLEIRDDFDIAMVAVGSSAYNYKHLSERLRNDIEIAKVSFRRVGWPLKFSGERVKSDFSAVLKAVNSNDFALEFASKELRNNRDVVRAACVGKYRNGDAFIFASNTLKMDMEFIKSIYPNAIGVIKHLPNRLLRRKKFIIELLSLNGRGIEHLDAKSKNNKKYAKASIANNPKCIYYFSDKIKKDPEIQMIAYRKGL
jgi:hypothetical protein